MQNVQRLTLGEMREFVASSSSLRFSGSRREEIYGFVERTLQAQQYLRLSKKDKGVVRRYLAKISGRSLPQIRGDDAVTAVLAIGHQGAVLGVRLGRIDAFLGHLGRASFVHQVTFDLLGSKRHRQGHE